MATRAPAEQAVTKSLSGIAGLDSMTGGGLPAHNITAIIGSAGAGKTVLALQMLAIAASERSEPGIFVAFEETELDQLKRELAVDTSRDQHTATQRISQRERTSSLRHADPALPPGSTR